MGNLRWRIKDETSNHHIAVEKCFEALDLKTRNGLAVFLNAHRSALLALVDVIAKSDSEIAAQINGLVHLIDEDLADLGCCGSTIQPKAPAATTDISGLIYVIGGSRLGARILHKRVRGSEDHDVRRATRYLSNDQGDRLWKTALNSLNQRDATPEHQDAVIAAAVAAFECFEESIELAKVRIQ